MWAFVMCISMCFDEVGKKKTRNLFLYLNMSELKDSENEKKKHHGLPRIFLTEVFKRQTVSMIMNKRLCRKRI